MRGERNSNYYRQAMVLQNMMVHLLQAAVDHYRPADNSLRRYASSDRPIKIKKWYEQIGVNTAIAPDLEPATDSVRGERYNTSMLSYHRDGTVSCTPASWKNRQSGSQSHRKLRF